MRLIYSIADQTFEKSASLGIYNFSLGLLRALSKSENRPDLIVLANPSVYKELSPHEQGHARVCDAATRGTWGRLYWDHVGCYRIARKSAGDWLFFPKGFASLVRTPPMKLAVYVHDLIPLIFPHDSRGLISALKAPYFRRVYRKTLQWADVIFTNTEFTKSEIIRWAQLQKQVTPPIVVVGEGVELPPMPPVTKPRDQIMVIIRSLPHKRADMALDFVERWRKKRQYDGAIVASGELPRGMSLPSDWQLTGRQSATGHTQCMSSSRAVVTLSEYEGFGLPPVEAIIRGVPAVYSDIETWREVLDGAGYPFKNGDFSSFASALDSALLAPRDQLLESAKELQARHSWSRVAERILTTLQEMS